MSNKENPLPRPPKSPFGRRRLEEKEEKVPLMADRLAAAMAEGRLEDFIKEEMPDNEYARALAAMMMGMTGMMPGIPAPAGEETKENSGRSEDQKPPEETTSGTEIPEDMIRAVRSGDVKDVMDLLSREHRKRMPDAGPASEEGRGGSSGLDPAEKETLDQLMKIASENSVSIDWIVLRALRLYIKGYQENGRL